MGDNLKDKVNQLGERLKSSDMGQKITSGMSSMSFKMKEFFQGPSQTDNLIEEATAETLDEPDWATNLEFCDMINNGRLNSVEFVRGIKKRLMSKSPRAQYLTLVLLETLVKNCERGFSEVAAERVLDEMVKLIDDPLTVVNNRNKVLMLIESWGLSSNELRYLPVYEETYKSLKSRGIRFPARDTEGSIFTPPRSVPASGSNANLMQQIHDETPAQRFSAEQIKEAFDVAKNSTELLNTVLSSSPHEDVLKDDLTTTLLHQCRESQFTIQTIIETIGDNEAVLFEALNMNDEIQKVVSKYKAMKQPMVVPPEPEPAMIPVAVQPDNLVKKEAPARKQHDAQTGIHGENNDDMDDFDEMIFVNTSGSTSESAQGTNKKQPTKDDLMHFE